MNLKEKVLKQITGFLKSEYLSTTNVSFFMQQIRLLLEINKTKNKYKTTNHYCNWLLHKELNRSNSPIIIGKISNAFKEFETKNQLIKTISDALSLKKLVVELKEILWNDIKEKKLLITSRTIHTDEYWLTFIRIILNQIIKRPLLLKNNRIILNDYNFSIYGLQIVTGKNEKLFLEILSNELENKEKRILFEIVLYYENNNH